MKHNLYSLQNIVFLLCICLDIYAIFLFYQGDYSINLFDKFMKASLWLLIAIYYNMHHFQNNLITKQNIINQELVDLAERQQGTIHSYLQDFKAQNIVIQNLENKTQTK